MGVAKEKRLDKGTEEEEKENGRTTEEQQAYVRKWRFNSASAHHRTDTNYRLDSSSISVIRAPRFQARKPSYQTSVERNTGD